MADDTAPRTLTTFFDLRSDAEEAMVRLNAKGLSDVRLTGGEEFAGRADLDTDRGFWESISSFFFPDKDRAAYSEGLRRGGFLLTVDNVPPETHDEAFRILDEHGSVDLDERSESWRAEGWTGAGAAGAAASTAVNDNSPARESALASDVGAVPIDDETRHAYGADVVAGDERGQTADDAKPDPALADRQG